MKKLYPLFLLALLPLGLHAQPVINSCNNVPTEGDYINYFEVICDTTGISPGSGGGNQTWNYSGLTTVSSTLHSQVYHLPSNTPYGSFFPNSNSAVELVGIGLYVYYKMQPNSFESIGYYYSPYCEIYSDPELGVECPMHYLGAFADVYGGYDCSGSVITGSKRVQYDGYGTLILPTGTHQNIVRLHEFDTLIRSGLPYYDESYIWYDQSINGGLLRMSLTSSGGPSTFSVYYFNVISSSVGEDEMQATTNFSIYPNPAHDMLHLEGPASTKASEFRVIDISGKLLLQVPLHQSTTTIPVANLPTGIYLYQILDGAGRSLDQGKFAKE
jgi:hypothetical protein